MATLSLSDKLDKIKSPGLQSQQKTVVVLQAVESTLKEQKTPATPTGYFAALLSLLQQAQNGEDINIELATPAIYLLDVVLPYTPQPLLRSKFTQVLTLLAPVLLRQDAEAILLRTSVGCLESLLIAQDTPSWELSVSQVGPRRAVIGLLNLSMDGRPKVRKRSQDALKKVLRNPPPSPSIDHPAADMCAQMVTKTLEEFTSKANQSRKGNKSLETAHDPNLIHALQLTKTIAAASGGWPSKKIESLCELLLNIARTGNEYMTVSIFEIFEMIFAGMSEEISSAKLPRLMEIIAELRPAQNDAQLVPPWLAILSRGYDVSAQVHPEDTFQKLPDLFESVMQFLASSSQNVRISASECLISFVANCVPKQVILEPTIYDEKVIEKLVKSASQLLSVNYQAAWLQSFAILGAIFDCLRWRAFPSMLGVTKTIGEIRENQSFQHKKDADEVIGNAIRAMGPEAVLSGLPLNIVKPVKGQQGRAWMFPILRDYVANTKLAHFRAEMVPLTESMFQKVLDHGESEKTMEIKIYETVVQQIWSTLPGYCDLPIDLAEAFDQGFAELLANLLYKQTELRMDICRALRTLIESNQAVTSIEEGEDDLFLQGRVSKDNARSNLELLGQYCGNMLAVLFNVYSETLPQSRGPILQTINAFLSITPSQELVATFARVSDMLVNDLKVTPDPSERPKTPKTKDSMPPVAQTLMDLVITMSAYLPRENFSALFEIANAVIYRQSEPQLQKKAYKLIPRLAESEIGRGALTERINELQTMICSSGDKVSAPARRERLAAMLALLPFIPDDSLHFIPSVLSEVVICCKENNERARETAYELLVKMGARMAAANGAKIDSSRIPNMDASAPLGTANLEEYFTMVSAGLAAVTPHMISASITAISRLLYEFRGSLSQESISDLVQTMDLFLTSNNREIVKSCLGFVKVCVITLPVDLMLPRLASLTPNLITWSHEHKSHFKAKVKHIFERMIRRFGYDEVYKHCPESDRKLIVNIRKSKERTAKKKKEAASGHGSEDETGPKSGRRFENEYDQALYSSDSEASDDSDVAENPRITKKQQKGSQAFILEDENEPLDLLDKKALASISSTKPTRSHKTSKRGVKFDLDGKLILNGEDAAQDAAGGAMDVDGPSGEGVGVGAYVAALEGKHAVKRGRGGKLKFSNKRGRGDDDDHEELDGDDAIALKSKMSPKTERRSSFRGRGGGGRGSGRGGRSGKGGITSGRRGLGVEKRHGSTAGGVDKTRRGRL